MSAGNLGRSYGVRQIAPDVMIDRRRRISVTLDAPPSKGGPRYNLLPPGSKGSVFDAMPPLSLVMEYNGHPQSMVSLEPHRLFMLNRDGALYSKRGKRASTLFTATSKMMCPSLSMPAGPPNEGGTCLAAQALAKSRKKLDGQVCRDCYALGGNYWFPEGGSAQAIRRAWIVQQLQQDSGGLQLAHQMISAIDNFARRSPLSGATTRMTQELGVWSSHDRGIMVPIHIKPLDRVVLRLGVATPLNEGPFSDSFRFFESRSPRHDEVVGFFRVHDSGDLFVSRYWKGYVRAWISIAQAYPNVIFWIPSRMWETPAGIAQLQLMHSRAPNMVVRPSGAKVDGPPPEHEGLCGGTCVSRRTKKLPPGVHSCPVFSRKKLSCMSQHCRSCWLQPDTPISYEYH